MFWVGIFIGFVAGMLILGVYTMFQVNTLKHEHQDRCWKLENLIRELQERE